MSKYFNYFRYDLEYDKNEDDNLKISDDHEILFNPKIWNSHNKDDNLNFNQKLNDLINKEKIKKKGVLQIKLVNR
jgi:hypothetical protein